MDDNLQRKPLKKVINKIYKRQWLEGVLFGWIRGQKNIVPSITIEQAIQLFYKEYDITEEDFPFADCCTTYKRMNTEYFQSQQESD